MRRLLRFFVYVTLFLLGSGAVNGSIASDDSQFSEYEIKGAFLYKFAKFTDWPPSCFPDRSAPISLCIFGKDPFGDILNSLKGVQVQGRPLIIKYCTQIEALKECHVVFISASENRRLEEILAALKGLPILTIGEVEGFAQNGGAINFLTKSKKVQFEVNLEAVRRNGLKIGSQLLVVARIVGR